MHLPIYDIYIIFTSKKREKTTTIQMEVNQVIQAVTLLIPDRWRSLSNLKGSRITIP